MNKIITLAKYQHSIVSQSHFYSHDSLPPSVIPRHSSSDLSEALAHHSSGQRVSNKSIARGGKIKNGPILMQNQLVHLPAPQHIKTTASGCDGSIPININSNPSN